MSTCQSFPTQTKAQAIEGFCDEFPTFCSVSGAGVKSVPSDVEKSILSDNVSTNDENDCDGGFELTCPTVCGTPASTVKATYRVVADAFGGGKECPYHDGFEMDIPCPATPACPADCSGGGWDKTEADCPNCGYAGGTLTANWTGATQAVGTGTACPTTRTITCPARSACPADCSGGNWDKTEADCPTNCGYAGGTLTARWTGATQAVGTGAACPTTRTITCPAQSACTIACQGSWGSWPGCPSCGTTSTSHTKTRSWITTSTLPSGYSYSPACPTTETQNCPATPGCKVDCVGSWTSPTCPSCGTGASNPSQTWSMTTPAQNGGSCPNTAPAPTYFCPETPLCWFGFRGDGRNLTFTKEGVPKSIYSENSWQNSHWSFAQWPQRFILNGKPVIYTIPTFMFTTDYADYKTFKLKSYTLIPVLSSRYLWFPLSFAMYGKEPTTGNNMLLHKIDMRTQSRTPYDQMYLPEYRDKPYTHVVSGYAMTLMYENYGGNDYRMKVTCENYPEVRQLQFHIYAIPGSRYCQSDGLDEYCTADYSFKCDVS